jgi:hypothetical protein
MLLSGAVVGRRADAKSHRMKGALNWSFGCSCSNDKRRTWANRLELAATHGSCECLLTVGTA